MTIEQQDAQRIALVATNATVLYARLLAGVILAGQWPDGMTEESVKQSCVKDALEILDFTERALLG